jgi:hypothetical protein
MGRERLQTLKENATKLNTQDRTTNEGGTTRPPNIETNDKIPRSITNITVKMKPKTSRTTGTSWHQTGHGNGQ